MNHMVAGFRVGAPDLREETQGIDLAFALFAKRYPRLFSVLSLSVLHSMVGLGTHCTTQRWKQRKRRQKSGSLVGLLSSTVSTLVITGCMSVPRRMVITLVALEVARDVAHIRTRIYHLRRTVIGSLVTGSREEWYWVSRGVPVAGPGVVAPKGVRQGDRLGSNLESNNPSTQRSTARTNRGVHCHTSSFARGTHRRARSNKPH
jgi:hypothetical protein